MEDARRLVRDKVRATASNLTACDGSIEGIFYPEMPCLPVCDTAVFIYQHKGNIQPRCGSSTARLFVRLCVCFCRDYGFMKRYRKVTIWLRWQALDGPKWVASMPFVIFFSTAQRTAS